MLKKIVLFFSVLFLSIFIYFQFFFDPSTLLNKYIQDFSKSNEYVEIKKTSSVSLQLIPVALKISNVTVTMKDPSFSVKTVEVGNLTLDIPIRVLKSLIFSSSSIETSVKTMDDIQLKAILSFEIHKQKIKTYIDLRCKKNNTTLNLQTLKDSDLHIQTQLSTPYGLQDWKKLSFIDHAIPLQLQNLTYEAHQLKADMDVQLNQKLVNIKSFNLISRLEGLKPIITKGNIKVNLKSSVPSVNGQINCREISKIISTASTQTKTSASQTKETNTHPAFSLPVGMIQGKLGITIEKVDLKLETLKHPLSKVKGTLVFEPQELRLDMFTAYCGKDLIQATFKADFSKAHVHVSLHQFDLIKNLKLSDVSVKKGYLTTNMNFTLPTMELLTWRDSSIQHVQGAGSFELKDGILTLFDVSHFLKHLKGIKSLDDLLKTSDILDKKGDTPITKCKGTWKLNEGYKLQLTELKTTIDSHQLNGKGSYNGLNDQIYFVIHVHPHSTYKIPSFSLLINQTLSNPKFSIDTEELAKKLMQNVAKNVVQKQLQKLIVGESSQKTQPLEKTVKKAIGKLLNF